MTPTELLEIEYPSSDELPLLTYQELSIRFAQESKRKELAAKESEHLREELRKLVFTPATHLI